MCRRVLNPGPGGPATRDQQAPATTWALCGVGANYLHVTDDAADRGDVIAAAASAGLSAVFEGQAARASMDYPCHSPEARHWFRMRAEPLPGRHDVLLTHDDITEHVAERTRALHLDPSGVQDRAWPVSPDHARVAEQIAGRS